MLAALFFPLVSLVFGARTVYLDLGRAGRQPSLMQLKHGALDPFTPIILAFLQLLGR